MRGVIIVGNSTWKLSAITNRRIRKTLAKELDKLHALIKPAIDLGDLGTDVEVALGEFGDLLLDAGIVYGEVL